MMLPLNVPFHPDETPMSLTSRLAARNGTNSRGFCLDFDLHFQGVVDGDEKTLTAVAELGGIDSKLLLVNAFTRIGPRIWRHRGEVLERTCLRRNPASLCPACALADIDADPRLRPQWAVYGRAAWLLDVIKTCPTHNIELVPAPGRLKRPPWHDFTQQVSDMVPRLADLAAAAPRRCIGPLEKYVLARLDGKRLCAFLDAMPISTAVRLCETAGAVTLFGRKVNLREMPDQDRLAAGGRGFADLAGGPDDLLRMLDQMKSSVSGQKCQSGPRVAFGRLYTLLHATRHQAEFETVRDIARQYIRDNFAFAAEDRVFGKPVGVRKIHSLHTLSVETSIHPKRLRKHLRAAAVINKAQMALSDHNVLFDAQRGLKIANELSETLSRADAIEHLGATRSLMEVLIAQGLVRPFRDVTNDGAQDRYAVPQLDAFLTALRRGAKPAGHTGRKLSNIPTAARKACCSAAEIIGLILDGQIRTALRQRNSSGYLGLLVDASEVAMAVRGPETDGLSLRRVAAVLATNDRVVTALVDGMHLESYRTVNPINRCPQTLVPPQAVKKFRAKYVSLHALAGQRKVHIATMKSRLEALRIEPAFDPKKISARFYLRKDVEDHARRRPGE